MPALATGAGDAAPPADADPCVSVALSSSPAGTLETLAFVTGRLESAAVPAFLHHGLPPVAVQPTGLTCELAAPASVTLPAESISGEPADLLADIPESLRWEGHRVRRMAADRDVAGDESIARSPRRPRPMRPSGCWASNGSPTTRYSRPERRVVAAADGFGLARSWARRRGLRAPAGGSRPSTTGRFFARRRQRDARRPGARSPEERRWASASRARASSGFRAKNPTDQPNSSGCDVLPSVRSCLSSGPCSAETEAPKRKMPWRTSTTRGRCFTAIRN